MRNLETAGADVFHYDVMDGHFVPNLTIGPLIIKSLHNRLQSRFDVHLMVANPDVQIAWFDLPAVRSLTIHVEASRDLASDLQRIRQRNKRAGITLNPPTPSHSLDPYLETIDQVLVMSVNPGFAAQTFLREALPKIESIAERREKMGLEFIIQVDGGINQETIAWVRDVGADEVVAGNAIFGAANPAAAYTYLYDKLQGKDIRT